MKGKIRVFCRLRPLSDKEIAQKEGNALQTIDEFTVEHQWKDDIKQHLYDRVFDGIASQEDVFDDARVSSTNLNGLLTFHVFGIRYTCYVSSFFSHVL